MGKHVLALVIWLCMTGAIVEQGHAADKVPVPGALKAEGIAAAASPQAVADAFLGMAYRADGTIDELGRFTLFERPDREFPSPGLNCSGFVLSCSRFLLGKNITLAEAVKDSLGDSGPGAPLGQDWDFGWDLIRNIARIAPHRQLTLSKADIQQYPTGLNERGFPLADINAWEAARARMRPGHIYLGSVSKLVKGQVRHHHVVLVIPEAPGRIWLTHATPKSGTHKLDIASPQGLQAFIDEMERGGTAKMIFFIEADLP